MLGERGLICLNRRRACRFPPLLLASLAGVLRGCPIRRVTPFGCWRSQHLPDPLPGFRSAKSFDSRTVQMAENSKGFVEIHLPEPGARFPPPLLQSD